MSFLWAVAAFFFSVWMTRRLCDPASRFHILDQPNERSLHVHPTPRGGGLAIVSGIFLGGIAVVLHAGLSAPPAGWIGAAAFAIAGVSYADDRLSLSPVYRLIVHVLAAALVIAGGLMLRRLDLPGLALSLPAWLGVAITLVFVVWMVNLYNFMDGMDGFAGGMAVFGFGTFAALGWMADHGVFLAINLVIAASAAGFLVFNFPPARIFMGDVGSSTLGFLAAALSLWGTRDGIFPFWTALLIFSPFIVDATATLLRRLLRREKIWQAHKTHYYQRLVRLGWGHRKTVLCEYALMAACTASAFWAVRQPAMVQWGVIGFWAAAYVLLIALVHRLEAAFGAPRFDRAN